MPSMFEAALNALYASGNAFVAMEKAFDLTQYSSFSFSHQNIKKKLNFCFSGYERNMFKCLS